MQFVRMQFTRIIYKWGIMENNKILLLEQGNKIITKQTNRLWVVESVEGDRIRICRCDIPEERILTNDRKTIYANKAWQYYDLVNS